MPDTTTIGPPDGAAFLRDLGFLLTPDGADMAPAYLLVALRSHPTLNHFDPERVDFWVEVNDRGQLDSFSRATRVPVDRPFSWGTIRVVDRLEVANEYLTFGGRLSAANIDGFTVAVFASPAPIVRSHGHSQSSDPVAPTLAAYFARLRAAAGSSRDLERQLCEASPQARHAAYLRQECGRFRSSQQLQLTYPRMWQSVARQERRLKAERPTAWVEGARLLDVERTGAETGNARKETVDVGS